MSPEKNVFGHLDMIQLARKEFNNPTANVTLKGQHLFDWKAVVNKEEKGMNFAHTYRRIYGDNFLCFATGVHAYDWKIIDLKKFSDNNYVVPILYTPSELVYDIEGVRGAIKNIEASMSSLQNYYYDQSKRYFKWVPPLVFLSTSNNSEKLNKLASVSNDDLINFIESEFKKSWDMTQLYNLSQNAKTISIITFIKVKVKDSAGKPKDPNGEGGRGRNNLCVIPPVAIDYPVNDYKTIAKGSKTDAAFYVLAHEGGHAFGLPHTCHNAKDKNTCLADPKNAKSIMHEKTQFWVGNNGACLGPSDLEELKKLKVFRYTKL